MIDFLLPLVGGLALLAHHKKHYGVFFHKVGRRPMIKDHGTLSIILMFSSLFGLVIL